MNCCLSSRVGGDLVPGLRGGDGAQDEAEYDRGGHAHALQRFLRITHVITRHDVMT